jgi:hypothetical protein
MTAAVETVHDFLDGINHEMDTGDSTPAVKVFMADCLTCIDDVASVHDALADGHTLRGNHLHFLGVQSTSVLSGQAVRIVVTERQDGGELLDSAGTVIQRFTPAPPTRLAFSVDVKKSPPLIWQIQWLGT